MSSVIVLSLSFPSKSSALGFGDNMADTFGIGVTTFDCPFGAPEDRAYTVEVDCSAPSEALHYRDVAVEAFGATSFRIE